MEAGEFGQPRFGFGRRSVAQAADPGRSADRVSAVGERLARDAREVTKR